MSIQGRNVKIGQPEVRFSIFSPIFNLDFDPLPVIFPDDNNSRKCLSRRDLSNGGSNSKMLKFPYLEKKLILDHF